MPNPERKFDTIRPPLNNDPYQQLSESDTMPLPYLRELYTAWRDAPSTPLTDEQEERFARYAALLQEWNSKMNLTAITDEAGIVVKHFMDSLSVLTVLDERSGKAPRVLDVGTGAGFPGIPLAIMRPTWNVTLLESTRKKVDFLVLVGNALGLTNLNTVWGRAEDMGQDPKHRERYHIVVARAVAEMPVLAEYCLPFVQPHGCWVAQKSMKVDEELAKAKNALGQLGGKLVTVAHPTVPGMEQESRALVVVQKVKPTPALFPRKAGMPSKKPL